MIPVITIILFVALLYTVMSLSSGVIGGGVGMAPAWWYVLVVGFFVGMSLEPVDGSQTSAGDSE